MATKKTNAKTAARAKAAKRSPGNAKALRDKAADNVKRLRNPKPVTVSSVTGLKGGNGSYVTFSDNTGLTLSDWQFPASVQKVSKTGTPKDVFMAAVNAVPKPAAKLANGLDTRNAPHSAKAVRDARAAAKPAKAATPKAAKNKQPARGTDRSYTVGKTKNTAKADSWRGYMLTTIMGCKDTAAAKAKHAKAGKFSDKKLDFNWAASQGYITFAK